MKYKTVIGLEIHVELKTKSKIYCSCKNSFGAIPNTQVCPICMGAPGALPKLNKKVVELAVKTGLLLNCKINKKSQQARKNYFYPDLPKGYQISQNDFPLCSNGYIEVNEKKINIKRIHIEEDAGKLIHNENNTSSVDFNRCGVPLIEIVTEPDISSSNEAICFLENLKAILEYAEISDCKMQEGSLRCDVNISLSSKDSKDFGTRCEIKNLNSFTAVKLAIDYEINRQAEIYDLGKSIIQETRRWDEINKKTVSMRTKEDIFDYMYFPEPDLLPIYVSDEQIKAICKDLPELPTARKERFINDFALSMYDADIITSSKALADLFEECVSFGANAKSVVNWLMGDVSKLLNEKSLTPDEIPFKACDLAKLISLIEDGTISNSAAKKVLAKMFESPENPEKIVSDLGLLQLSDSAYIKSIVDDVILKNSQSVNDYKNGNNRAFGFLIGQAMKQSKGAINPKVLNEILYKTLNN